MAFIVKIMHLFWFLVFISVGRNLAFSTQMGGGSSSTATARGGSSRLSPGSASAPTSQTKAGRRRFHLIPKSSADMAGTTAATTKRHQTASSAVVSDTVPPPPATTDTSSTTTTIPTATTTKESKKEVTTGGGSSIPASIFNLVNNVAGAGILTLSAGMASGTGWLSASIICALMGFISSHTFTLIGEACQLTGEQDFKGLWARTMGPNSTFVVDGMIAILCLACTVIYSGILGDVFTPLLARAGLAQQYNGRSSNIIILTIGMLLPLCMIKNLSALAFTSILGFCSILYTVVFIVIRSLDGTYKLGTGKFLVQDALLERIPSFAKSSMLRMDFTSLVLVSNLGLAYIAHYNGPAFYRELKDTNSKRFGIMVRISFVILTALYVVTMISGYRTFGDVCQGNLLLNYHPNDTLSTLGRIATGLSILFGYPLIAAGAREGISGFIDGIKIMRKKNNNDTTRRKGISRTTKQRPSPLLPLTFLQKHSHLTLVLSILSFATMIACTVKDVSLVVGLTGAAMGSMIVFCFPVWIYCNAIGQYYGWNSSKYHHAKLMNYGLIPFGILIGGLGVFMTLKQ